MTNSPVPLPPAASGQAVGLQLSAEVITALRTALPLATERTIAALGEEVPEYATALGPEMMANVEEAVRFALTGFLDRIPQTEGLPDAGSAPGIGGAYALGRGEARSGRSMDALLTAYRVGARASWREWSATLIRLDIQAATVARFAELVFAYIDELSAASVAGHADELATTGRVRDQHLERLGRALLTGEPIERLLARAQRAEWPPPESLVAVVLPSVYVRGALALLDARTLVVAGEVAGVSRPDETDVLLVADAHRSRAALLRALHGRNAVVGPPRPWADVAVSFRRVLRAQQMLPLPPGQLLDVEDHLVQLVVEADREALDDLRDRVLQPLAQFRPATAERLAETLRLWLLHQGRREAVAAALNVHPQTVRYRLNQLRAAYGERLTSPEGALELIVALATMSPTYPELTDSGALDA